MFLKEKLEGNLCDLVLDRFLKQGTKSMDHKILMKWISLKTVAL